MSKKKPIPLWLRTDLFFEPGGDVLGAKATRVVFSANGKVGAKDTSFTDDGKQETFTVAQIASLWQLSTDTIQRIFEEEPGVLVQGSKNPRGKRKRVTLRIPREVMTRVKKRRSNPT